jgi:hypothetical protein
VLDADSGRVITAIHATADMDDLYYDAVYRRIYVPGGQGSISAFEQSDTDHYRLLSDIPSAVGARTAGYAAKIGKKGRDRFILVFRLGRVITARRFGFTRARSETANSNGSPTAHFLAVVFPF